MNMKKLFNNEAGVSPIVATLVLVVVAIAGAAAVGTIMGSFSSDVSDSASVGDASASSSTELVIAGSTTVQPVAEIIAEKYMKANPGIKVSVSAGGSGAGIASTELDIVDIGMSSETVDTVNDHPDLQAHQIGGSGVVIITKNIAGIDSITKATLEDMYDNAVSGSVGYDISGTELVYDAAATTGTLTIYKRGAKGASGTQDTLSEYLPSGSKSTIGSADAELVASNTEMADTISAASTEVLGFCDFGFVEATHTDLTLDGMAPTEENILNALTGDSTAYGPIRPLIFLTNGNPSTVEQSFIDFAMQYEGAAAVEKEGFWSAVTIQKNL